METDQDINIGRLKEFIENLPVKDSRIYEIQSGFDLNRLKTTSREVVEKHHVRHISTLHRFDGNICEMWYYGRTKVKEYDSVIKVSIFTEDKNVELFAATQTLEGLTGLLAEFGREIKDAVELGVSGRGNVSLIVRNSKIDRINLVDLCNMDGTCDKNIIIENTSITRTDMGSSDDHEIDLPRSNIAGVNGNRECPVCFNIIDQSNKSLLCQECGTRFCQTCESWYREERERGEHPLCKSCFTAEQERKFRDEEENTRLKREQEEQERLHWEKEKEEILAKEAARLKAAEEAENRKKAEAEKKWLEEKKVKQRAR
ncbi:hypothetical protein [uncultured Methanomethylovorans sp.]|uniref:hypothetical protein n=1 Tax=uncultured Methanomethylovorans sp. TaxID=183759 RepID=UPI002AA92141|nr:hypothetical protein [uncultured Methanomethylovorans sp.]